MNKLIILTILITGITSCNQNEIKIIDKPIDFTENRERLTLDYIGDHYGIYPKDITIKPKIIVLHWTESNDFDESFNIFKPEKIQYGGIVANASQLNVSVHFLVDRDGTIYRLMPETWMARHVIGINYHSIGVENVGGKGAKDNMTNEQIETNIELVKYLAKKYPTIEYLIGHYEYTNFESTRFWMEKDPTYRTVKTDPSEAFMTKIREEVVSFNLIKP